MNFYDKDSYSLEDLNDFLELEVEENIYLDYKDGAALCSDKINEITKDISAFANSDGGIIIYGVRENRETHKPDGMSAITNPKISKEWIEQQANRIQPQIKGLRIFPIRLNKESSLSIYIVKIPRSEDAPHMAYDNKYYRRDNFSCNPMHGYQVRDTFYRYSKPFLRILGVEFEPSVVPGTSESAFFFKAFVQNDNKAVATLYKMNAYIFTTIPVDFISLASPKDELKNSSLIKMDKKSVRYSVHSNEPIFKNECITMGNVYIQMPESLIGDFIKTSYLRIVVFFEGGFSEILYIPQSKSMVKDKDKIKAIIKSDYPDYNADWL